MFDDMQSFNTSEEASCFLNTCVSCGNNLYKANKAL